VRKHKPRAPALQLAATSVAAPPPPPPKQRPPGILPRVTVRRRVGGNPVACGRTEQSGEGEKTGDAPDRAAEFATYDRRVRVARP